MVSENISSFKPRIGQEIAGVRLRSAGMNGLPGMGYLRPLRSVAALYIPFRFYKVSIRRSGIADQRWMAIDLLTGRLDPFEFAQMPDAAQIESVISRNHPPPALDDADARDFLTTKIQRILFQSGFFRMKQLEIAIANESIDLHMPYWLGLYGLGDHASLQVLDATRNVLEGGKLRRCVYDWLAGPPQTAAMLTNQL